MIWKLDKFTRHKYTLTKEFINKDQPKSSYAHCEYFLPSLFIGANARSTLATQQMTVDIFHSPKNRDMGHLSIVWDKYFVKKKAIKDVFVWWSKIVQIWYIPLFPLSLFRGPLGAVNYGGDSKIMDYEVG